MTQNRFIAVQAYPAPSSDQDIPALSTYNPTPNLSAVPAGIMILPDNQIYPGAAERSSRWFGNIQPISGRSSQTTTQFLGAYPLNQSFRAFIQLQISRHLPQFRHTLPSQSEIADKVPLEDYQHLFEIPGFSTLELPESPTFSDILEASSNRVRFYDEIRKTHETALLHLTSSRQEWIDNRSSRAHIAYLECQDRFNKLTRLNEEDVDNARWLDTFSRRVLSEATDREKERLNALRDNHAEECHYESEMVWLRLHAAIPRIITARILGPTFNDPHTTPISSRSKTPDSLRDEPILPISPMVAAEREIEATLRSRIDQIVGYATTQITKYSRPSLLEGTLGRTTPFQLIITHTIPGILATNDSLGLLGLSEMTINSRRQEAVAVIALLVDPALMTARDLALLRNELPITQTSTAIDAIIERHRLFS